MANQFNNQKCSKCYSKNVGLEREIEGYYSGCQGHSHFFKKNGWLFCINCLMAERHVKCQKCHKLISHYDELGKFIKYVVISSGDHTCDVDDSGSFGCMCRKCSAEIKAENKSKPTEKARERICKSPGCSNIVSVNFTYNNKELCTPCGRKNDENQAVLNKDSEPEFEKYKQFQAKAQSWWSTLSSQEREWECKRLVENMKQGKYWANNVKEGEGSGWACDGSYWTIENGKFTSRSPHLVPIQIVEEFMKKEIGFSDSKMVEHFCSQAVVKKDNNDDKNSPSSPSLVPQEITNSNSTRDDSASLENSPQLNPGKDKSPKVKINVKTIRFENKENNSQNFSAKSNDDDKIQIIDPRNIKQITLTADGNLVIEFNSEKLENGDSISQNQQVITSEQINNNQELQKIKNYCQKNGKNSLSQQELNSLINGNKTSAPTNKTKNDNNNTLAIGLVAAFALIVGLVIGLVVKRKKRN